MQEQPTDREELADLVAKLQQAEIGIRVLGLDAKLAKKTLDRQHRLIEYVVPRYERVMRALSDLVGDDRAEGIARGEG